MIIEYILEFFFLKDDNKVRYILLQNTPGTLNEYHFLQAHIFKTPESLRN